MMTPTNTEDIKIPITKVKLKSRPALLFLDTNTETIPTAPNITKGT